MKILLVHGLGRSPLSMWGLASALQKSGFETELFGYAAFAESYRQITQRLRDRCFQLSAQGTYGIVAHSLGGVLTRSALAQVAQIPQHVVMLGTPNQPPRLAQIAWKMWPFRWFSGTCGASLVSQNFYHALPQLLMPYTIIAGTSGPTGRLSPFGLDINDGLVAVNETKIVDADRPIKFPGIHGFMMNNPSVQARIAEALRQK
ncbi:MAG: alpha/beta fold hydrolase [Cyanobacteria bacterium P01_F01_bin.42]